MHRFLDTCTLTNCDVCEPVNVTVCKICKVGYVWDPFTLKCQFRKMNCLICGLDASNNSICLKCEDGYNLASGECSYVCKLNNCKTCNPNSNICK